MSSTWTRPTPAGLSSAKQFRFRLAARALDQAENLRGLQATPAELLLTIARLRSALDDALRMVGEVADERTGEAA